ncbi:MAG: hypothetical protein MSC30_12735 [Gaiellaceae bacterium MAG52_C11]|nr:hypothetical protein [Candidatus Gaiellasilicea maunaloa]
MRLLSPTPGSIFTATAVAVTLFVAGFIIAGAGYGLCNENSERIAGCETANSIAFAGSVIVLPALVTLVAGLVGRWSPIVIASSLGVAVQLAAVVYLTALG